MTKEEIDSSNDSEEDEQNLLTPAKVANHYIQSMSLPSYDCTIMSEWNTYYEQNSSPERTQKIAAHLMCFIKYFCSTTQKHDAKRLSEFVMVFGKYKTITAEEAVPILSYINKHLIKI
jgi:hypothetical protein